MRMPILIKLSILFIFIFVLFLVAYEDNVPFALLKKILCKMGFHKRKMKIEGSKTRKYYCQWCGEPRKHPKLEAIDGGIKQWDNYFKY